MKKFKSKKSIIDQQYDKYWALTVEYCDIYDIPFNNTLRVILDFIDIHKEELKQNKANPELNKELQQKIWDMFQKKDKASTRKSINQFIKLGFVNPYYNGYHELARKFLNEENKDIKKNIFSQIFYENSSFCSSYNNDKTSRKEINFLLKTLLNHPMKKLNKIDVTALMVTPIEENKKGYLTKDELESQYNFAKNINFKDKKYNQIRYLYNFLRLMPDLMIDGDENIEFYDPENSIYKIDKKRDPILYNIYKTNLKLESVEIYGDTVCYLTKKKYKGLISSHIHRLEDCLSNNDIEAAYDFNNGLLLAPHIDAYFDKYDISFDENGKILFGKIIDKEIKDELKEYSLDSRILNKERLMFLRFHRDKFYEKNFN